MTVSFPAPIKSREDLIHKRRISGMSQGKLAEHLHLTANAISHIETGRTKLTRRVAAHAAMVFAYLELPGDDGERVEFPEPRKWKTAGRPATLAPLHAGMPRRWQYRTTAGEPLRGSEADALPLGTEYQGLHEQFGITARWRVFIRHAASAMDDIPIGFVEA